MLPVIALVGRPNVGKSTLFNRLTRSRDALVADQPGLTRDRQYGIGKLGNRPYLVVDTGGLTGAEHGLDALTDRQVQLAIGEADWVLFLVDAKAGRAGGDQIIADQLRRTGKPVTLVVNKSEGALPGMAEAEFHDLNLGEGELKSGGHRRGSWARGEDPDQRAAARVAGGRRNPGPSGHRYPDRGGGASQCGQVDPGQPPAG